MSDLDTDVVIDVYRGHAPAVFWLTKLDASPLSMSGFVRFEMAQGCRSGEELRRMERLLSPFSVARPSEDAMRNALRDFGRLSLSHNISAYDGLIAHAALERGATLFTSNLRHFAHFAGLDAKAPYER